MEEYIIHLDKSLQKSFMFYIIFDTSYDSDSMK